MSSEDYISLKWGTLKAWNISSERAMDLLAEYASMPMSLGAMNQEDTPRQKEIICELIEECAAPEIYLDWKGEYVSKDRAKEYVRNYGAKSK